LGKWSKSLVFGGLFLVLATPFAGAAELVTTHPSHYARPGEAAQGSGAALLDRTKEARAGSHVVVRDPDPLPTNWVVSAELSRACTKRQFRQKRDQFLVGIVEGRTYGAAVGGHGSLLDRANLAENQVIYLFRGQDTTDCRVYHRLR